MSLYIHPDNQTILWNTIGVHNLFGHLPEGEREEWFRNIVSQFHRHFMETQSSPTNAETLMSANKQTIQYMVKELRQKYSVPVADGFNAFNVGNGFDTVQMSNRNYEVYNPQPSTVNVNDEKNTKIDETNSRFNKFQMDYNTLLKPVAPVTIDFTEPVRESKLGDGGIDELLKQQQAMRENDIAKYAPPPPVPQPQQLKDKIQSMSGGNTSTGEDVFRFSELNRPPQLVIQPPSSNNWSSYINDSQVHLSSYAR